MPTYTSVNPAVSGRRLPLAKRAVQARDRVSSATEVKRPVVDGWQDVDIQPGYSAAAEFSTDGGDEFIYARDPDMPADMASTVHAVILAGGPGSNPLAQSRAVPALPIGGNHCLVDVAIGNCLQSGINKLHVLTQFNSHQLNSYLMQTYRPMSLGGVANTSFVDCITCTQTPHTKEWSKGSADALRRALPKLHTAATGIGKPREVLVITGADVYDIKFSSVVAAHRASEADITMITKSTSAREAGGMGTCAVNARTNNIERFVERPSQQQLEGLKFRSLHADGEVPFESSCGMYVFSYAALEALLGDEAGQSVTTIGQDVIPEAMSRGMKVQSWHYEGAFSKCSSLRDYMDINLRLASAESTPELFSFMLAAGRTGRSMPPSRISSIDLSRSVVSEGSILLGGKIEHCVLGVNSFVHEGADLKDSLINGLSTFHTRELHEQWRQESGYAPGIGKNVVLRNTIVDFDACVGNDVQLVNAEGVQEADHSDSGVIIQDGIIIVLAGARVPDGFRV